MLAEAVEILRQLWSGEDTTYRGRHMVVEDARILSLPDTPPWLAVAGTGPASLDLTVEHFDVLGLSDPVDEIVAQYQEAADPTPGPSARCRCRTTQTRSAPTEQVMRFSFGIRRKVMLELLNIVNFRPCPPSAPTTSSRRSARAPTRTHISRRRSSSSSSAPPTSAWCSRRRQGPLPVLDRGARPGAVS